jgi:hypothetical protein
VAVITADGTKVPISLISTGKMEAVERLILATVVITARIIPSRAE